MPINGESVLVSGEFQPSETAGPEYVAGFIAVAGERVDVLDLNALVASTFSQDADSDACRGARMNPSASRPRIVLVDSNVYFSKRIGDALKQQGFDVIPCAQGPTH